MAVDGTLIFDTKIDESGFNQGTSHIKSSASALSGVLGKIGAAVASAFAVKKLIDFGKSAIQLASDVDEVQNVVDTAFGSMKYKMEEFAETAIETYGISKLAAKQTGSTYMSMARGMGLASESASDMSVKLTGLSADMASFYNAEQNVTAHALNSIFTGETESLKKYGIVMTDTNLKAFALSQGIKKSYSEMSQAEKVQLRYQFVMKQTALAQGDFARTSDGWANQTRILSEQWKEFSAIVGDVLKTVLLPAIKAINNVLSTLIKWVKAARDAIYDFFGWEKEESEESDEISDSYEAIADDAERAATAVERQLMGFDKINKLNNLGASSSSASAIGPSIIGGISGGVDSLNDQTKKRLDEQENMFDKWIDQFKNKLSEFRNSVKGNAKEFVTIFGTDWENANVLEKAAAIVGGTFQTIGESIMPGIGEKTEENITDWLDIFGTDWDNASPLEFIGAAVLGTFQSIGEYILPDIGKNTEKGINTWLDIFGTDWEHANVFEKIGAVVLGTFQGIGESIISVFKNAWTKVKNYLLGIEEQSTYTLKKTDENTQKMMSDLKQATTVPNVVENTRINDSNPVALSTNKSTLKMTAEEYAEYYDKLAKNKSAKVPAYATGTVIPAHYGEFLGLLGDNNKETEVVSPLSTIKKAVKEVMGENGNGDITLVIKLGEDVVYKSVVNTHKKRMLQTGVDDFA